MSLISLSDDINERRTENRARVVDEDYRYLAKYDSKLSPKGEELAETAAEFEMSREKFIELRRWVQETSRRCRERLEQEKTLVYTLNEARDRVLAVNYVTTGEAAVIGQTVPGDLLSLDDYFGGLLVRGRFVFISDAAARDGLDRYAPDDLLNGLVKENLAA